jgi:hypothetical protein
MSPPGPHAIGIVTVSIADAVTAASTALPPSASIRSPTSEARRCAVTTMPLPAFG